jgi:hypothetical protein
MFVFSDPFGTRLAILAVREISREIVVLTRTKYGADMDIVWDRASTEVIAEEFEASLELMTRILVSAAKVGAKPSSPVCLSPCAKHVQHGHRPPAGDHCRHHSIPLLHSASLNLDAPQFQQLRRYLRFLEF